MVEGRWASRAATSLLAGVMLALTTPAVAGSASASAVGGSIARHPVARHQDSHHDPLRIRITGLSPGVLPDHGPVEVSGTIINDDSDAWTQVNLYPYLDTDACVGSGACSPPMTTDQGLAEGAASDPSSPVGERVTDESVRQTIDRIDPGESVSFTMEIPHAVLRSKIASPQPGVYWFGVQASGQSDSTPRDQYADGRARTFLPYLPPSYSHSRPGRPARQIDTAIVVPVRTAIRHQRDGRLAQPRQWLSALSPGGALDTDLALGTTSGSLPVTWLVDPAVPDAVRQLAAGNPGRLIPAPGEQPSASGSASASASSATNGPSGGTSGSGSAGPLATAAADWLDQAKRLFSTGQLLTLPYGDTELVGSDLTPQLYKWSRAQRSVLTDWKLPSRKALSSPDGYVDPDGLAAADDDSLLLLGDRMLRRPATSGTIDGHPFAALSGAAADGGPEPSDRTSPVALRQRILSEAVVRLIEGSQRPLVVQLPAQLGSGPPVDLWSGLEQPWLHLTTVSGAMHGDAVIDPSRLRFPGSEAAKQLAGSTQAEAIRLVAEGDLLQSILTPSRDPDSTDAANAGLANAVRAEALSGTSYSLRGDADAGPRLDRSRVWIGSKLEGVTISAPPGVTLSSSAGSFAVTVNNSLDVPVTVEIAADASGARVTKTDPVELAAQSRASVRLDAHTSRPGVHNVHLRLTDRQGAPIGGAVTVPIRSGSVGVVIWAILAVGAGILFFAIVVRLVRRIRGRSGAEA